MPVANWRSQSYNVIQSLLFNNRHRVISYQVKDEQGNRQDRAAQPAPVRRLYETETPPERTCLQTIQFVHHMLIPPGERHVRELHIHPDAEEIVVITRGRGVAIVGDSTTDVQAEDVIYIPPGVEHEVRAGGNEFLGALFINVPTGSGLVNLQAAQQHHSEPQSA